MSMRSQHLGHFAGAFEHESKALLDREAGKKLELESELPVVARFVRGDLEDSRGIGQSLWIHEL